MEKVLTHKERIDAHNKLYEEGKVKYKLGLWELSDMTVEERKKHLGGISMPSEEDMKPRTKRSVYENSHYPTGPDSIDWRTTSPKLVGPVYNQGFCGSCWTYSVSQVVDALARKKNMTVQTSPQQMIDCDHQKRQDGCDGGWPPHGLDYAVANGLSDLNQYPIIVPPVFVVVGQPPPPKPKCHYDKSMKVVSVAESITVMTKGKFNDSNK